MIEVITMEEEREPVLVPVRIKPLEIEFEEPKRIEELPEGEETREIPRRWKVNV